MTSKIKDGGPAFPVHWPNQASISSFCELGMSLRDYFAGQAMAGMNASLTSAPNWPSPTAQVQMASCAYAMADAMLAERAKESKMRSSL
jgi:hypothetical protein